ncbi:MAG TPA: DUF2090 domain-containing protein [Candidatus Norongarragalinales archaeon]|nr:DUF2090 domain-containing protein [Candidatus Norongarragalinales archaeon]
MQVPSDLLILAFDHRGSFKKKFLGAKGEELTPEQLEKSIELKRMIYDGFKKALDDGVSPKKAGMLLDEEMGSEVLAEARNLGYTVICPAEKSGKDEFDFEYGPFWKEHILKINPTFCKVLIRYNPESDADLNKRQGVKLKELGAFLKSINKGFLIEPLVPATPLQLDEAGGNQTVYDLEIRPKLMVRMIQQLQNFGVEPDIWKLEGVDRPEDAKELVRQARSGNRQCGIVTLGRGESKEKVAEWLKVGAHINGIIGFAIGRTIFSDSLSEFVSGKISREQSVKNIADTYKEFVTLWETEKNR